MLPPVYALLKSNPTITGKVDDRIYRHGNAPQGVKRPYITWFLVANRPEEQLSGKPCSDFDLVQIDAWSEGDAQVEQIAYAVRDTLDGAGISNRMILNSYDNETKLFRLGLEADFIRPRST